METFRYLLELRCFPLKNTPGYTLSQKRAGVKFGIRTEIECRCVVSGIKAFAWPNGRIKGLILGRIKLKLKLNEKGGNGSKKIR